MALGEGAGGATEKGSTLARAWDAATSIGLVGPRPAAPGRLDSPRAEPALAEVLAGGELVEPRVPGGPWTLTTGDSQLRLYDLGDLGEPERQRIEAEASVGLALGELSGVVPTRTVRRHGEWLAIERPLVGETLADRLASGAVAQAAVEPYADGLRRVARILQGAHDRGLVHLDLRPERIAIDPARVEEPRLTDFAIDGAEAEPGPDPYVAQERFLGERGPSVDQYALGVIAHEVFTAGGARAMTEPVRRVIARATAVDPAERFPTIGEFGEALRAAVAAEAPRGLADRIEALSPARRSGLGPGLVTAAATVIAYALAAPGSDEQVGTMVLFNTLGAVVGGGLVFIAVALATWLRGTRRLPGLRLLGRPAVQVAIFFAALAARFDGIASLAESVSWTALIVFGGCALLSPRRPAAGREVTRAARLWDRRFAWTPAQRRSATTVGTVALVLLAAAPALAKTFWGDFEYPTTSAAEFGPLAPVWNLRTLLSQGKTGTACEDVMAREADREPALCRQVAGVAAAVQARDPVAHTALDFAIHGEPGSFRVQELPGLPDHRLWYLLTPQREVAGFLYTLGAMSKRVVAMVSRQAPRGKGIHFPELWRYDVVWNGHEYRVAAYRACSVGRPGTGQKPADCIISSSVDRAELDAALGESKDSGG
jgi:hypothetical protein